MIDRSTPDSAKSSFAQLQKKFQEQETVTSKNNSIQNELAEIAKKRQLQKDSQPLTEKNVSEEKTENIEIKTGSVKLLSKQLSTTLQVANQSNVQKMQIAEEIKNLRASNLNIHERAKEIEKLMTQNSKKVIAEIKRNEVSAEAQTKLNLTEFYEFKKVQNEVLDQLQSKLENDIKNYHQLTQKNAISQEKFLNLSFVYRSYEVCLQQDLLLHIAHKNKNNLYSIPSQQAIQSLNYYHDFFMNLIDVEALWKDAGKLVRRAEIAISYATFVCQDNGLLTQLLDEKNNSAHDKFNNELTIYINKEKKIASYIELGDGLDMQQHPWTLFKCARLKQANSSINFKQIFATDKVHETMLNKVDEKVEEDRVKFGFK